MKVDCDFKKWGDRQHYRFDMDPLGRDEHGTWLGCRAPVTVTAGPRAPFDMHHDFVTVVPDDGWWIASFNAAPAEVDIYVGIATPAKWLSETHVTSIDLDLDVVRWRADGRIEIVDQDELEEHAAAYGYPDGLVRRARQTADEMLSAMSARHEPFGDAGFAWLSTR